MNLWWKFNLAEFDPEMRQDDEGFVNLLNKKRVGENDQNVEQIIESRFIDKNDSSYPNNFLHNFAGNIPVKIRNENHLKQISGQLIIVPGKYEVPANSSNLDVSEAQNREQS